jgi:transketolase
MRHDPSDPTWLGRDRFVLSCGHSSLTQYIQLFLSGYGLQLADLKALRTWGSQTPGHPEVHHTTGVEITTGPLGSGLASAVGMAMAQRRQRGLLDPDAKPGESPFDHHIWVIASDGDLMEGVTGEASSLAGHQELGNLTVVYDANQISIEDDTDISFSEDVAARYAAYGWDVVDVDWRKSTTRRHPRLHRGRRRPLHRTRRQEPEGQASPTLIACTRSSPGRPRPSRAPASPTARPSAIPRSRAEGSCSASTRRRPSRSTPAVLAHARKVKVRGKAAHREWDKAYKRGARPTPDGAALLDRLVAGGLPAGLAKALPSFPADAKGIATRAASGKVLGAMAPVMPELWGGSADLAESNNTTMAGEPSFIPKSKQTRSGRAAPTAAPCTSASASSRWA